MALHDSQDSAVEDSEQQGTPLAHLPRYCVWATWGFVQCWLQTRRLKPLLQGIPVLALAFALAVLFLTADQPVSSGTIAGYVERANQATANEEFEQAEFYFRKLDQLAPQNRDVVHQRALLYDKQGNFREAFRLMESLVQDEDRTNDVKIHLWLAQTALRPEVQLDQKLDFAKYHLNAVLEDDPSNRHAQVFFTRLYMLRGDVANAIAHLERIEQFDSELQLLLASLYQANGDAERARQNAQNAVDSLATKIRTTQTADANVYHQLAAGQLLLREYAKAESTLFQAQTKFNLDATRRQLSRVYVAWSDEVAQTDSEDIGARMQLLEKALIIAPNEPLALNRMVDLASAEGGAAEEVKGRLEQALVEGIAPASVHFSLGALAAKSGDTEAAMRHFRLSQQLNPRTAVTLNNIAYLMAQSKDADLEQALELVNQALEMAPNAAPFRETRGQVLVRLGRWSEAIADLEFANSRLAQLASRISINGALATAYDGLGDAETAESYRRKAKELTAEAQETNSERSLNVPIPQLPAPDEDIPDAVQP